jgi:hypothetical protein
MITENCFLKTIHFTNNAHDLPQYNVLHMKLNSSQTSGNLLKIDFNCVFQYHLNWQKKKMILDVLQ